MVNGIGVMPPEDDSDDEIAAAVTLVLESDPFVNAAQTRTGIRRSSVTLTGVIPSGSERAKAEFDAWLSSASTA